MTDRELLQQALEALEEINKLSIGENAICLPAEIDGAMDALRERLAQPEQEPVAWITEWKGVHSSGKVLDFKKHRRGGEVTHRPLYTTPQPRQWQGLTDEEIADIYIKWDATPGVSMADFARAIEAKLKEKNHG